MNRGRWITLAMFALMALESRATNAFATPARSQSLLAHVAISDETDISFFPAALSEYPTQIIGNIRMFSSGSGGLIYNGRFGIGLFVNRAQIARSRLSESDDITLTSRAISQLDPDRDSFGRPKSPITPTPEKILDLLVSSPDIPNPLRIGVGFSLSHQETTRRDATVTLIDETGLPQSVAFDQQARSTLITLVQGVSLVRDRYRVEASLDITPAFFRAENRLLGEPPTTVSKEKLAEVDGVVLRQDGFPSVGGALRWQTRGGAPVNWTTWVAVDRRDLDSANPATGGRINAFASEINVQGGPQVRIAQDGLVSVLAEFGIGGSDTSRSNGPLIRERFTVLPGIRAAAEKRIGRYVGVRGAISHRTRWNTTSEPDPGDDSGRRRQDSLLQSFKWAIGVSGYLGGLTVDADIEPDLVTHGPSLVGGDVSGGRGPGLFSTLSVSYAFPRQELQPNTEAPAASE